jgi:hypothetical protein
MSDDERKRKTKTLRPIFEIQDCSHKRGYTAIAHSKDWVHVTLTIFVGTGEKLIMCYSSVKSPPISEGE